MAIFFLNSFTIQATNAQNFKNQKNSINDSQLHSEYIAFAFTSSVSALIKSHTQIWFIQLGGLKYQGFFLHLKYGWASEELGIGKPEL